MLISQLGVFLIKKAEKTINLISMKQLPTFITQTLKQQNLLRWNSLQTTF